MKKIIYILNLSLILILNGLAQTSDEYHKNEFSGGYLYRQPIEITSDTRFFSNQNGSSIQTSNTFPNSGNLKFQGFNVSYTRNFHRFIGVKGEFSRVTNTEELRVVVFPPVIPVSTAANYRIKSSLSNYLGGIQIKDNSKETRFKPFAHFLFGIGQESKKSECFGTAATSVTCSAQNSSKKSFAAVFGGGMDIKLNKRIDIRAIQFDYNPMKIVTGSVNPSTVGSEYSNKYRIGVGIVIH